MEYIGIFIAFFSFFLPICYYSFVNKTGLPTNWPLVGMLPALFRNHHRINELLLQLLEKSQLTFLFKGPWLTNMRMLVTVDPANIHHVMTKNFSNYVKGSKFNENMEVFGEGVLNTDSDVWQYHRRMAQSSVGHPRFQPFLVKKIWEKVESGLIPVLDHLSMHNIEVDLQDLFARFTFDNICTMVMDHDPKSLSIDFPSVPASKALDDVEEVILHRFTTPTCIWKFQRWLGLGLEKRYKNASRTLDTFIYKCLTRKQEEMSTKSSNGETNKEVGADILTLYIGENGSATGVKNDDKFLRDTVLAYIIAGRDTTTTALSWFFYLLSKNPKVVSKIREELEAMSEPDQDYNHKKEQHKLSKHFKNLGDKLVYLHGALCEALRLYPPVVFEAKVPIKPDILPSGHQVDPTMQIIFDLYAMARMKSIWGDDCNEFKPERWISEKGSIKYEPSYKFLVFNAGPRTCLGKHIAFTQMKAVAATIIKNYNIEAVEGHPIVPALSIILRMKYGFKVKVHKFD